MQGFPREVILGLVLVDLPINLDQKKQVELREEAFGESWWYITCDCDDHYVDIVKEVLELCNYEQAKALCFISDGPDVLFRRASPKCKQALANAMRFCSRFELHDEGPEPATYNAVDYGTPFDPIPEGQRVLLRSYSCKEDYEADVRCVLFCYVLFQMTQVCTCSPTDMCCILADGSRSYHCARFSLL
jgi:hypothetical protein